jgi:hypothetical protein
MALVISFNVIVRHLGDAAVIYVAICDVTAFNQLTQPLRGLWVKLVVISTHWLCLLNKNPDYSGTGQPLSRIYNSMRRFACGPEIKSPRYCEQAPNHTSLAGGHRTETVAALEIICEQQTCRPSESGSGIGADKVCACLAASNRLRVPF